MPPPIFFLAFANDRDDRLRYLRNLAEEARGLQKALAQAERGGLCRLVVRQNASLLDILDVFQDPAYRSQIAGFHYAGHASGYQLLFESAGGSPAPAGAASFAAFLGQQRGLQLVFLNGCSTQPQAQALLEAGVPVVVATAQAIDDRAAAQFATRFYQGLAGGASLGTAFKQAEAAVQTALGGELRQAYGAPEPAGPLYDRWPWSANTRPGAESVLDWDLPTAAGDPLFGLPPLPLLDLPASPYRRLDWFRRADAEIFFGRGRQIRTLYERLTSPHAAPILLLYGQSGVGKSSLLAAGLLPRLEPGYHVCYQRRDRSLGLLGSLQAALAPAARRGGPPAPPSPTALLQAWLDLERRLGLPAIAILDQVEEAYTRPNPHQPDELPDFLAALGELFADPARRPQGRLVLSFRKEWLAELQARLAGQRLPHAAFFLERLDRQGVLEVVTGPTRTPRLQQQYGLAVEADLPAQMAADLLADPGSAVAPTLQILLSRLWEWACGRDPARPVFDLGLYYALRQQGLDLDDFLEQQLALLRAGQAGPVDSGLALDLLAFHTTPLGTAGQRTPAELQRAYPHQRAVLPGLVQHCQDLYLLVDPARGQPGQPPASRLAHDLLAPLVRRRFEESDLPGQRARRILEGRAPDWRSGRTGAPLDDTDLALVVAGLPGMRGLKAEEARLLSASRTASEQRRLERERLVQEREAALRRELERAQELAREQQLRAEEQARARRQAQARELAAFAINELNYPSAPAWDLPLLLARQAVRTTYAAGEPVDQMTLDTLRRAIEAASPAAAGDWSRLAIPGMYAASFSPDGGRIVGVEGDTVRVIAISPAAAGSNHAPVVCQGHRGWVLAAVFSPDGAAIATAGQDGSARLWDAAGGQELCRLGEGGAALYCVAFHPDGSRLLAAGGDGIARLWALDSGEELLQIPGAKAAAFSPDGARIVTCAGSIGAKAGPPAGRAGDVAVWDAGSGEKLNELCGRDLQGYLACLGAAAFSPDGSRLVTAHAGERCVRVWELAGGREIHCLQGHIGFISAAAFSPDGSQIVSASCDGRLCVWDALRGSLLLAFEHPSSAGLAESFSAAFSPDGRRVIYTDYDGTARLHLVSIPALLEAPEGMALRAFTPEERQRYLHEGSD